MRNVSADTLMNCERKICFAHARESNHDLKCVHQPCNCKPFSKIGRLSLFNIELNLFQERKSAVHWSDLVRRLYHDDWFVAMDLLIFHILMIPKNDAPTSTQLPANAGVIALRMHVLGTCQAVGWCTCANCC